MIFESLYIRSFGKLRDRKIEFSDGVNIIEGDNESGKSTLCSFIRFIFYGLPQKTEEKLRHISWQTSSASGTLTLREGQQRYRIEREVIAVTAAEGKTAFREKCSIYDADTNALCFKGESPAEVFFGVSASVFESTAYIRQTHDAKIGGKSLGEEAENILFSGSESVNTKKAIDKLDAARVFLLHKNQRGGKITELESQREEVEGKLEVAKKASEDIIYLEGTHRQFSEKKAEAEARLAKVSAELDEFNKYSVRKACLRSKAEKARLIELEDKIEALRTNPAHGGMDITDADYILSLEKLQNDLSLATSRYADAETALKDATDKLSQMSEKLDIFERFGAKGGGKTREEMISRTKQYRTKAKRALGRALVSLFAFILFALLAVGIKTYVPTAPDVLPYVFLALVPVFFISMVVCLILRLRATSALKAICTKFGCKSYAEFEELVRAATEDEAFMIFITSAREEAYDRFTAASDTLEVVSTQILDTLQSGGFEIAETTAASLTNALERCRETRTELVRLETAADEVQGRIDDIAEELSAYSTDYLREALFATYDEDAIAAFNLAARKRDRDFLTGSIATQTEKLHQIEIELATLRSGDYRPGELAEEKAYLDNQIETLTKKWSAYMLAIESIERASGKLREGLSPKIASNAGRLMSLMSDGQYATFGVDGDFALSYSDGTMMHDAATLSAGTGDLAYLCLRIALIELLYKKAMPPLLFDESFVRMDDRRLKRVMLLLHKYASRQCQSIILSCHAREREMSNEIGKYHSIRL
ncbi:MAG: AAA family ATPase [Clostridia bacterium]|nr:AAA family ATPase [Clostridia bacterium]